MPTLYDAALAVADYCLTPHRGAATETGTTATLKDATRTQAADFFAGGSIFFRSGANAGKFARVTGYSGTTFTFEAQDFAPNPGDLYTAFPPDLSIESLVAACNNAARDMGAIDQIEHIETEQSTDEYELPYGVRNISRVEVASGTSEPIPYYDARRWEETPDGKLRFFSGYGPTSAGYDIRITYRAPHAVLTDAWDEFNPGLDPDWLTYGGAINALREMAKRRNAWAEMKPLIDEAQMRAQIARRPAASTPIVKLAR
jgi:hypothetical protein